MMVPQAGFGGDAGAGIAHYTASQLPARLQACDARAQVRSARRGYMSICRICDSCMLVCQTSSKKFR